MNLGGVFLSDYVRFSKLALSKKLELVNVFDKSSFDIVSGTGGGAYSDWSAAGGVRPGTEPGCVSVASGEENSNPTD